MTALLAKVEIGLDLGDFSSVAFRLDDATKGKLDNTSYTLGGALFFDITDRVKAISTRRGKNQALDKIDAGLASITFDNSDRFFDPLYPESEFFRFLIPRREVRVTSNGYPVFIGFIEDLDFDYSPGNISTVKVDISDGFSALANAELPELATVIQYPGARITQVLDSPEVNWSPSLRQIDAGVTELTGIVIPEGTEALGYLQLINQSENGQLFIGREGNLIFRERDSSLIARNITFTDDLTPGPQTKIPYVAVNTVYGSESLYNRIVLTNNDSLFPVTTTLEDADSQKLFGVRTYTASGLLTENLFDLEAVASELLATYKEPRYRFESITVNLDKLNEADTEAILDLEIGELVGVSFTPNDIPPAINNPAKIIGIAHDWTPTQKRVTFSLENLIFGVFILDNSSFGVLDTNTLS